jgi:hypothetical protein
MAELAAEIIRRFLLRLWQSNLPDYRRHFADTSAESSAQMRDDFEVTSSAIWCIARIRRAMHRLAADGDEEGDRGLTMN